MYQPLFVPCSTALATARLGHRCPLASRTSGRGTREWYPLPGPDVGQFGFCLAPKACGVLPYAKNKKRKKNGREGLFGGFMSKGEGSAIERVCVSQKRYKNSFLGGGCI